MTRTIAILAEDDYEDMELWYPYYRLIEAGATVRLVGSGRKPVFLSKHGYEARAELDAKDVREEELDGVIVPGGFAPDRLRRVQAVNELVRRAFREGKLVAAICHGPSVLVSANVLKGRKATCFTSIRDDVINAGARYIDQAVVVDGNLVTSRSPADLPDFMRAVLAGLGLK